MFSCDSLPPLLPSRYSLPEKTALLMAKSEDISPFKMAEKCAKLRKVGDCGGSLPHGSSLPDVNLISKKKSINTSLKASRESSQTASNNKKRTILPNELPRLDAFLE